MKERDEILQSVYLTMWELKTHEIIENMYIMNKLRDRLDTLKVMFENMYIMNKLRDRLR